ncbi:MAG: zf-HC2 domain-containing protein [Syntrophomonadaceae bacterium]|jgi:hypothetical protein|nr:zf-HC2 domain-containing protein [Syntrophomonadaceae bacterium]
MRCEQIKEHLSAYMDQMTNERENQLVEAHLAECESCRQELEQLQLIHSLLVNLDAPQIPDRFAEDLHMRLLSENPLLFSPKEIKRPRKQAWIAAAVAGLALAVGIFSSSFLPAGSIANLWQDKKEQSKTTSVAVEDIIQRFQQWRSNDEETPPAVALEEPGQDNEADQPPEQPAVEPPAPDDNDINEGSENQPIKMAEVDPQIADVVKSQVKVDSLAGSVDRVLEIAQACGAESWLASGTTMQALTGSYTREIHIKAPRETVKQILEQLEGLGNASAPMAEQVELTEQYREAVTTVDVIAQEIEKLEAQGNEADVPRIQELKEQHQNWSEKKARIERDASLVTIKVYLVEEEVQH